MKIEESIDISAPAYTFFDDAGRIDPAKHFAVKDIKQLFRVVLNRKYVNGYSLLSWNRAYVSFGERKIALETVYVRSVFLMPEISQEMNCQNPLNRFSLMKTRNGSMRN